MERCSTSFVIKEMQIGNNNETTMNYLEQTKCRTLTTSNADEEVEQQELSVIAGGNAKWIQLHWNKVWQFLENLNIVLPCHQVGFQLGIYPKKQIS